MEMGLPFVQVGGMRHSTPLRASRSPKGSPVLSHRSDIVKQGMIFQFSLLKSCWGSPTAQPIVPELPEGHTECPQSARQGHPAAAHGLATAWGEHTAQANCVA